MALIKSAYEMALERTKDIAGDKEALEENKYKTEGKKIISQHLGDEDVKIKDELKRFDKKQGRWVREGMVEALLANLVLPADELAIRRSRRIGAALAELASRPREVNGLFSQLEEFFKEYVQEKRHLREAVEQQYRPRLQQKEQELSKQLGQPVHIDPNSDPEFVAALRQNLNNFDLRYSEVVSKVKEQITQLLKK